MTRARVLLYTRYMKVHRIRGFMASSYLIESDGLFLVDAGFVGHWPLILAAIRCIGRRPQDLRLALVTHPHLDHFGGLPWLRDRAEFPVAAHPGSALTVSKGGKEYSPGLKTWSRAVAHLAKASLPHLSFRGAGPILGLADGERLDRFGLPATVLHTPGHTDGCVTVLLDDGTAFTGDLAQGPTPVNHLPSPPAMATSPQSALASWRRIIDAGARRIMPGHGRSFSADDLAAVLGGLEVDAA